MAAFAYATETELFDFNSLAELFLPRSRKFRGQSCGYRRFVRAADAIRFAIEEMPAAYLLGTILEVEETRIDGEGIRQLYDSAKYPLKRKPS